MKTPEEIIRDAIWKTYGIQPMGGSGEKIIEDLDAAGYAIVPKEPTEEMLLAGTDHSHDGPWAMTQTWKAMIAAAQKKPAQPCGD